MPAFGLAANYGLEIRYDRAISFETSCMVDVARSVVVHVATGDVAWRGPSRDLAMDGHRKARIDGESKVAELERYFERNQRRMEVDQRREEAEARRAADLAGRIAYRETKIPQLQRELAELRARGL